MKCSETSPVTFNCIKHHLSYISDIAGKCKAEKNLIPFSKDILNIGHSPLDIYTGKIDPSTIVSEIVYQLKENHKFTRNDFGQWIKSNHGYQQLLISDSSAWTLRFHETNKNYLHIHPARNSRNVIRVNASLLKTAVIYAAWGHVHERSEINITGINFLRTEYLSLPPLKKISDKFLHLYHKIKKGNE